MSNLMTSLSLEAHRLAPVFEELARQLHSAQGIEAERKYANYTLRDIAEPALAHLKRLESAVEDRQRANDPAVNAALNFFATLPRFAGERRFPSNVDVQRFLGEIDAISSIAGRLYIAK